MARYARLFSFVMKTTAVFKLSLKEEKKGQQGDQKPTPFFSERLSVFDPRTTGHFATRTLFVAKKATRSLGLFLTNKACRKNARCATAPFFLFYILPSPCPLPAGKGVFHTPAVQPLGYRFF